MVSFFRVPPQSVPRTQATIASRPRHVSIKCFVGTLQKWSIAQRQQFAWVRRIDKNDGRGLVTATACTFHLNKRQNELVEVRRWRRCIPFWQGLQCIDVINRVHVSRKRDPQVTAPRGSSCGLASSALKGGRSSRDEATYQCARADSQDVVSELNPLTCHRWK